MKLILYQDGKVIDVHPNVNNAQKTGIGVKWDTGELSGVSVPFILVSDTAVVEKGGSITEEWISSSSLPLGQDESSQTRNRLESAEMAIITLMDLM